MYITERERAVLSKVKVQWAHYTNKLNTQCHCDRCSLENRPGGYPRGLCVIDSQSVVEVLVVSSIPFHSDSGRCQSNSESGWPTGEGRGIVEQCKMTEYQ